MSLEFWVIIPARYASTRLPGKPLLPLAGRPMLAHVHARALESGAVRVIIATDDTRIAAAARGWGAEVCMTSPDHASGTDRVAEAARQAGAAATTIIVNVQGDEPMLPPPLVRQAAEALAQQTDAVIATLCEPLHRAEDVLNPNIVKLVRDARGFALYFSRAPIPWLRDPFLVAPGQPQADSHFRHIGLYAYRNAYLQELTRIPPCPLEQGEALEQLRVLYHGAKIYVADACTTPGPGVDTADDLARVRHLLENLE